MRRLVFVPLAVLFLASCGETKEAENSGQTSVDTYADAMRGLQRDARGRYTAAVEALISSETGLRDFVDRRLALAVSEGRRFVEEARALAAPSDLEDVHGRFVSNVGSYLDSIEDLQHRLLDVASEDEARMLEEDARARIVGPKQALDEACMKLQEGVRIGGSGVDFHCSEDWLFGSEDAGTGSQDFGICGVIDPFVPQNVTPSPCSGNSGEVKFGGVTRRLAPMPPLPPNLVAVSAYLVLEINADNSSDLRLGVAVA